MSANWAEVEDLQPQVAWLLERDCRVQFRHDVWWECRIECDQRSLLGTGSYAVDAFHEALEQIFPKPLAWELLWEKWEGAAPEIPAPSEPEDSSTSSDAAEPLAPELSPVDGQIHAPQAVATSSPDIASVPEVSSEPRPEPAIPLRPLRVIKEAPPVVTRADIDEAEYEVKAIHEEIAQSEMDVALWTPPLMRGQMSLWICRARAVEERVAHARVEEAVHQVALLITRYAKLYWPGSVRALGVSTRPQDGLDGFGNVSSAPPTWDRAAVQAQRLFDELFPEKVQEHGGWPTLPPMRHDARDLRELQQRACRFVESLLGDLGHPPGDVADLPEDPGPHRVDLLRAARDLRCIRRRAPDPLRWGRAVGRLRWYGAYGRDQELTRVLHYRTKVEQSWVRYPAQEREEELAEKRLASARRRVLNHRPGDDVDVEVVVSWLRDAFSAFTNPEIAKLCEGLRDRVRELDPAEHEFERGERSRLRRLLPHLDKEDLPEVVIGDAEEDDAQVEVEEAPPGPAELLLQRVRERVAGKKAIYFNTRRDRQLEQKLASELDLQIDHRDPDRWASSANMLSTLGRWDLVLVNTAFIRHTKDRHIRDAAKTAGATYVNVYNGLRLAVLRGLARELGIEDA